MRVVRDEGKGLGFLSIILGGSLLCWSEAHSQRVT